LLDLWNEHGIHPAEAAHDAQSDAFMRYELLQPGGADITKPENMPSLEEQPPPAAGSIMTAARDFLPTISAESRMSHAQCAAALRQLDSSIIPAAPDAETMATPGADKSTAEFFAGRGGRF
jgi:hypothetical protein